MSGYLIRCGDALSQMLNSVWRIVIDAVLWFDADHCRTAYLNDVRYSAQLLNTHGRK